MGAVAVEGMMLASDGPVSDRVPAAISNAVLAAVAAVEPATDKVLPGFHLVPVP